MGKKHKNKEKNFFALQALWWFMVLTMSFVIWYRTLQMSSNENLLKIRNDPRITNDITIFTYYAYGMN